VERYVSVVKRSIKAVLSERDLDITQWDECLPSCLIGLRFFQHKTLGLSPFTLCTGLVPRVPVKSQIDGDYVEMSYDVTAVESYVSELVDYMSRLCKQNVDRLRRADQ
jgi:hypothetical protein